MGDRLGIPGAVDLCFGPPRGASDTKGRRNSACWQDTECSIQFLCFLALYVTECLSTETWPGDSRAAFWLY